MGGVFGSGTGAVTSSTATLGQAVRQGLAAQAARGIVDGSIGGGVEEGLRAAFTGGNVLTATARGAAIGGVLGGAFGAGARAFSFRAPNSVVGLADDAFHATTSPGAAQGVLNGIDPRFLNPDARFGRAFYVAEQPGTTLAELAHHGATATHGIRFNVNSAAARVLDLTDPTIARAYGYNGGPISSATQAIGERARAAGFNAIRFKSLRGPGNNIAILDDFNDILSPQFVSPAR